MHLLSLNSNYAILNLHQLSVPTKLLILAQSYPPDIKVSARRWGNLVAAMQEQGINCTVISVADFKSVEYTGDSGERVIRLGMLTIEAEKTKAGAAKKSSLYNKIINWIYHEIQPSLFRNPSYRFWIKLKDSFPELINIAASSDFIISSYGPIGPLFLGYWLSKKTRKPWVADIRDSFESKETDKISIKERLINRTIEKYLLHHSNLNITIGVTLAKYLSNKYNTDFHSIYNGWVDTDQIQKADKAEEGKPFLYYAGSIYKHRLPALSIVIKAIKDYPDINLKIRLVNDNFRVEINSLLNRFGNSDQIELLPPVPPGIVKAELAQSLCAIVIEDISNTDILRDGTVTGKLLSLLASGIPGIAVSSSNSEIRYFVDKIDGWHGVDSVGNFQKALSKIILQDKVVDVDNFLINYHMKKQAEKLVYLLYQIKNKIQKN